MTKRQEDFNQVRVRLLLLIAYRSIKKFKSPLHQAHVERQDKKLCEEGEKKFQEFKDGEM